jgi:putative flippase GtrA
MTQLLRQSIRFAGVGIINTAVGLSVIWGVMFFFGAAPAPANAAGYAIGLGLSFVLNRSWTFGSRAASAEQLPRFMLVAALSYLVNLSVVMLAISQFSVNAYLAQLVGAAMYTVSFFFGCRCFVFAARRG